MEFIVWREKLAMMANYTHTFSPIFDFYDVQHAFWYALLYAYAVFADWLCVMILIIIGPVRQPNQGGNWGNALHM